MIEEFISKEFLELKGFLSPTQYNLIKILKINGPLTRRYLVKILNTSRTTIYDNLIKLQKYKIVEKFIRNNGEVGRPLVIWKVKD
ncbi:MAG: hypothetical protein ACTSRI_09155 [Promethearchaeota archaeon]